MKLKRDQSRLPGLENDSVKVFIKIRTKPPARYACKQLIQIIVAPTRPECYLDFGISLTESCEHRGVKSVVPISQDLDVICQSRSDLGCGVETRTRRCGIGDIWMEGCDVLVDDRVTHCNGLAGGIDWRELGSYLARNASEMPKAPGLLLIAYIRSRMSQFSHLWLYTEAVDVIAKLCRKPQKGQPRLFKIRHWYKGHSWPR